MELFRIVKTVYANSLVAPGSVGRWNKFDEYVLYTSSTRSLSTLEIIVRKRGFDANWDFKTVVIHVPDDERLYKQISVNKLPDNWRSIHAYDALQAIGSAWYQQMESLILQVPSAIVTQEYNYLINTRHPLFDNLVKRVHVEPYLLDSRLA